MPANILRLLLVESAPKSLNELGCNLQHQAHRVHHCQGATLSDGDIAEFAPHIILLDIPENSAASLELAGHIRQLWPAMGLMLLTERQKPEHRLRGYELGADYCLNRPLAEGELLALAGALMRRLGLPPKPSTTTTTTCWRLAASRQILHTPHGTPLALSRSERRLLECLQCSPLHQASRKALIEALGAEYLSYDERRLEAIVSRLRRKLSDALGSPAPLRGLRTQGYKFTEPLSCSN